MARRSSTPPTNKAMPRSVRSELADHLGRLRSPTAWAYVERGYVEGGKAESFLRVCDLIAEGRRGTA